MTPFKSFWQNILYPGLLAVAVTGALLLGMAFLAHPDAVRSPDSFETSATGEKMESSSPDESWQPAASEAPFRADVPPPVLGPSRSEIATLNALWANCQSATRNNARGEYPAMQRMSCHDYQVFAQKIGVEANAVAAVREAAPQPRPDRAYTEQQARQECQTCRSLFAEKDRLDERMRRYAYGAQEGEYLRNREREVSDRIYDLRCSRFSKC